MTVVVVCPSAVAGAPIGSMSNGTRPPSGVSGRSRGGISGRSRGGGAGGIAQGGGGSGRSRVGRAS